MDNRKFQNVPPNPLHAFVISVIPFNCIRLYWDKHHRDADLTHNLTFDLLLVDGHIWYIKTVRCFWEECFLLTHNRPTHATYPSDTWSSILQFVHNLFWLKLKWNARSKLFYFIIYRSCMLWWSSKTLTKLKSQSQKRFNERKYQYLKYKNKNNSGPDT